MKTLIKIIGHSLFLCACWIIFGLVFLQFFGSVELEDGGPSTLPLMWLTCLLNVSVIHYYLIHTSLDRFGRFWRTTVLMFGIQFFMTQMESWYFIDAQVMSRDLIIYTVVTGLFNSLAYGLLVAWTYPSSLITASWTWFGNSKIIFRVALLALIAYPLIYFTFGYFIAWQSPAIREYYSGSVALASFWDIMKVNMFESNLYLFQIFRSALWLGFGWIMLTGFNASKQAGMVALGLLFAVLMNSQLLIPNNIMPNDVRLVHAIETASSNFIWGALVVYGLIRSKTPA